MSVKIGHAVMDENGETTGRIDGDQTGKEVAVGKWYAVNSKGIAWDYYLELKSKPLREKLARFIEAACDNNSIGYSQPHRTGLFESLREYNCISVAHGDVDCTSLIFMGLIFACGISVPIGYSGNMHRLLRDTGMFNIYTDAAHLKSDSKAKRGGIYLRNGHALTVLEDGPAASELVPAEDGSGEADQIDPPYVLVVGNRVNVRIAAGSENAKLFTANKGDKFPFGEIDDDTGWYAIETPHGLGFISNRKNLTRLVEN